MAEQIGIVTIKGTMNNMTFYKSADGMRVKMKSAVSKEKIKSGAGFQRTRENMSEFGAAGKAGKVLRNAINSILVHSKDRRVVSRLTTEMLKVVKADATSTRGNRNVLDGELEMLTGFNFNKNAVLSAAFRPQFTQAIDRVTGELTITIPPFIPANMMVAPQGATHYRIVSMAAEIDFEQAVSTTANFETGFLPLDSNAAAAVNIQHVLPANSTHPLFLLLGIQHFQDVNGSKYPLKNGAFNSLELVEISGL